MAAVTICLTTYNRPELLKESVNSVLNQTFSHFELIIANDFISEEISFDSLGIEEDSRVKIINNKYNLGEIDNSNNVLNISQSEWFCFLSDDDLMHPSFLESLFLDIHASSDLVAIYPNFEIGKSPKNFLVKKMKDNVKPTYLSSQKFIKEYFCNDVVLIGVYGLIKTSILKKIGGLVALSQNQNLYSDIALPIMISEYGKIGWINKKLIFNRAHSTSRSMADDLENLVQAQNNLFSIVSRVMKNLSMNPKDLSMCNYKMFTSFAATQMFIISRSRNKFFQSIKRFIVSQNQICFYRIKKKYWFIFIFRIKILIAKGILRRIKRKILN